MKTIKDFDGEWTRFRDASSGGTQKLEWSIVFIQASVKDATKYLNFKYDVHPEHTTCRCCGTDYTVAHGEAPIIFGRGFVHYDEMLWNQGRGEPRKKYFEAVKKDPDWTYSITREEVLDRVLAHVNGEGDRRGILIIFADEMEGDWQNHDEGEWFDANYDDVYDNYDEQDW